MFNLQGVFNSIAGNGRAFCCAGILCSVSRQLKPIEKLKLKLNSFVEIYSVSRIWADSDKKMSLYVKGFGAATVRKSAAKKNFADY